MTTKKAKPKARKTPDATREEIEREVADVAREVIDEATRGHVAGLKAALAEKLGLEQEVARLSAFCEKQAYEIEDLRGQLREAYRLMHNANKTTEAIRAQLREMTQS